MKKVKIFMGHYHDFADEKANEWLEKASYTKIIDIRYVQKEDYKHSIFIIYEDF